MFTQLFTLDEMADLIEEAENRYACTAPIEAAQKALASADWSALRTVIENNRTWLAENFSELWEKLAKFDEFGTGTELNYFATGQIWRTQDWVGGLQHGGETVYYLREVTHTSPDDPPRIKVSRQWVNGKKEGIEKHWFRNGQLEFEANWEGGRYSGEVKYYTQSGEHFLTEKWRGGSHITIFSRVIVPDETDS